MKGEDSDISYEEFRRVMGSFLSGVTIVTTRDADGEPRGLTANSFSSVSLEPPLISICVAKTASSYEAWRKCDVFTVNILAHGQQDLATRFASRSTDKFSGVEFALGQCSVPLISGALAWVECTTYKRIPAGDHVLLIGSVVSLGVSRAEAPLGYYRSAYVGLGEVTGKVATSYQPHAPLRLAWIYEVEDRSVVLIGQSEGGEIRPSEWSVPTSSNYVLSMHEGWNVNTLTERMAWDLLRCRVATPRLYSVYNVSELSTLLVYRARVLDRIDASGGVPELRVVDEATTPWDLIPEWYVRNMLKRYYFERSQNEYGIYVGPDTDGVVEVPTRSYSWREYTSHIPDMDT